MAKQSKARKIGRVAFNAAGHGSVHVSHDDGYDVWDEDLKQQTNGAVLTNEEREDEAKERPDGQGRVAMTSESIFSKTTSAFFNPLDLVLFAMYACLS